MRRAAILAALVAAALLCLWLLWPREAGRGSGTASRGDAAPAAVARGARPRMELARGDAGAAEVAAEVAAEGPCRDALLGQVVNASGGPVAGARIRGRLLHRRALAATSDETGAFRLCLPVGLPGDTHIEVSGDGYGRTAEDVSLYGQLRRTFVLAPEAPLAGRVVDPRGEPVAGAVVAAVPSDEAHEGPTEATSDAAGRFAVDGLRAGVYLVRARARGLAMRRGVPARVRTGVATEVELRLEAAARVAGQVVDTDGQAVEEVAVVLQGGEREEESLTDAEGRFVIDWAAPVALRVAVRGRQVVEPSQPFDPGKLGGELRIRVDRGAGIAGTVVKNGRPLASAEVTVRELHQGIASQRAVSGPAGGFAVGGLQAGTYEVSAVNADRSAYGMTQVAVVERERKTGVTVSIAWEAQVSGVVLDARGAPVGGVYVRLALNGNQDFGYAGTAADGSFVAGGMTGGGDYAVEVSPSARSPLQFHAAGGGALPPIRVPDAVSHVDGVRIVIDHEVLSIAGRVLGPGGAPVPDVVVTAVSEDVAKIAFQAAAAARTVSDGRGAFTLDGLVDGEYRVRAVSGSIVAEAEAVRPGANVTLTLATPGQIHGRLVGFDGEPQVTVWPDVQRFEGQPLAEVRGTEVRVADVAPGRYRVVARLDRLLADQAVDVVAGQVAEVELRAQRPGRVEGHVTDLRTGEPLAGVTCWTYVAGAGARAATSDGEGRLVLEGTGHLTITCYRSGWASEDVTVQVAPGGTSRIDVVAARLSRPEEPSRGMGLRFTRPGLVVTELRSPKTTVEVGDTLVAVNGLEVTGHAPALVYGLLINHPRGGTARLRVLRGGAALDVELVLP